LAAVFIIFVRSVVPSPPAEGSPVFRRATADAVELIELIPEATHLAGEILDVVRWWFEISGFPAIGHVLDWLLDWSGLAPDDLPWATLIAGIVGGY
jgi:hypothetical protein